MARKFRIGPCYAFMGDFSAATPDVLYLGPTRGDVVIEPGVQIARGRTDQSGQAPLADGIWLAGYAPVITLPLVDEEKAKLARQMPGARVVTSGSDTALVFETSPRKLADTEIHTLALVPVEVAKSSLANADKWEHEDTIWVPGVVTIEVGQFVFGEIADTDDALRPHEVRLVACYREKLQNGSAVPEDARLLFFGSPAAAGLSLSYPDIATLIAS